MLETTLERLMKNAEAEGVLRGKLEGELEGKLEGKLEGEIIALQRLLTKRFGPLPVDVVARIKSASSEQIESWLDAVLDHPTLDAVFQPTKH